jgi:flagellar biosynthetic protein FliR
MTVSIFTLADGLRFLFLMLRLSAMVLTLPFLSFRMVPAHLKIVFIVILSLSLYPAVHTQNISLPQGPMHFGMLVLGELFLGMLIGFVVQLLFAGIQLGGMLMNQQMGLSMANILDPQNGQQTPIIANFQYILAVLLFFSLEAHHWYIYTMAESLHAIPLLDFIVPRNTIRPLMELVAKAFIMAIKLAAPVIVTLLLANIAMGIVARLVPQMNVFILSFPVNFGVGLMILALAIPYFVTGFRQLFTNLGQDLLLMVRLFGGG